MRSIRLFGRGHPIITDMTRWLQAGTVALAVACALVPANPVTVEWAFSTGLYPVVQQYVTPVSNLVPFALFDLITMGAIVVTVVVIVRSIRGARRERRWSAMGPAARGIITAAALAYLTFLGVWGLNYRRIPMEERLVMQRDMPDGDAVVGLGRESVHQLNALYASAHARDWPQEAWRSPTLRDAFASVQRWLSDAPTAIPGRVKQSVYGPYFRWTSVDGMVNPFALEVLANPDLLPFERLFVAAHEWAHLAGYADEAEANFVGWLTCLHADVPAQYSGWLYLYWQVSGELGREARADLWRSLDAGPRRDIEAIVERLRAGQLPMLRDASWKVYDQYLRANRVEEGVRSYGAVVNLVLRARFEDGWTPVRRAASPPSP